MGVRYKEKALTFDRGLFDQRLQMRFPRGGIVMTTRG
jgi:hypothetical protein